MPLRRGLTDYERKTEVESESGPQNCPTLLRTSGRKTDAERRHSEHLSLDARLHDLKALQEEARAALTILHNERCIP